MSINGALETSEVRTAGLSDLDTLVSLVKEFQALTPWGHVPTDEVAVRQILTEAIESDIAVVLMHDSGAIGGVIEPLWASPSYKIVKEWFWWSRGGGGALIDGLEKWARNRGANEIMLSRLGVFGERPRQMYERRGFSPIEHTHVKRF